MKEPKGDRGGDEMTMKAIRSFSRHALWVVLSVAAAGACGAPNLEEAAVFAMEQSPSLRAMKTHYPADYASLEARVRQAAIQGESDRLQQIVDDAIGPLMNRQRAKADIETSVRMYEVVREEGRALQKADAAACAAFMDGRGSNADVRKVATPDLSLRDAQVGALLLQQTATRPASPAKPMTIDELSELSLEALATLPDPEQDIVIAVLREERDPETTDEARIMCAFNLALADVILSRPRPIAGDIIRRMWAME